MFHRNIFPNIVYSLSDERMYLDKLTINEFREKVNENDIVILSIGGERT